MVEGPIPIRDERTRQFLIFTINIKQNTKGSRSTCQQLAGSNPLLITLDVFRTKNLSKNELAIIQSQQVETLLW